ncbi:MAG TPA: hypothetical protein PKY35_02415 [Candidatus Hydrogenedentes bacterium]|nr:hypothetical protein [Candidatus Hydrogenedentota bacterium]HOL75856.1 hypothetical protein [Candidatus Hydrogenedentota bacterium]HPO86357.1 hypothetical protein [Candidatus Hydrogenedentota bacterium]
MTTSDRFFRSVFVAIAVGLGWGIRGDFGHLIGAMYPGAVLGLAFCYVSGQKSLFRWMPLLAAISGVGIGTGGHMSYGILHGYAQSDTFINYAYGFFTLFLQGGAWGVFGCAAVGLLLEEERVKVKEWVAAIVTVLVSGSAVYFLVTTLFGFHINPPRSDASIGFTGGAVGLFVWLVLKEKRTGLRAATLGYVGFGMGMSVGRLFGNIANVFTTFSFGGLGPFTINHWNVMEVSVGLIGGFIFTWGMLGFSYPDPPRNMPMTFLNVLGALYVLGGIPLLHRLTRVEMPKKMDEWIAALQKYGYSQPEVLAKATLTALTILCVLGFFGALSWIYLHIKEKHRAAWFPVMCLSVTMLLYQNINALYFLYPRTPKQINMHFVFWLLFMLMTVYVIRQIWQGGPQPATDANFQPESFPFKRWALVGIASYLIVVVLAGFINGEQTMKSACTRWPEWSWREGPFPGREAPK